MTIRRNPGPGDDADDRPGPPPQWRHPSEVGLAIRGRTDRRRSTVIAVGLLLGGVAVLVSGVLLGSMDDEDEPVDVVEDRIEHAVANVVVVDEGISTTVAGLVVDDDGHVLVRAGSLQHADEIWARCADARMVTATVVASDEAEDLAVLRLSSPQGRPVEVSEVVPRPGLEVLAVDAVPGAVVARAATVAASAPSTPPDRFHAEMASPDDRVSLVFDVDGDLMGMSTGGDASSVVELRSASAMVGAAHRLLER